MRVIARSALAPSQTKGISAVGIGDGVPIADNREGTSARPVGVITADMDIANFAYATEGHFHALGMRLVDSRTFTERDTSARPCVLVPNERLSRQQFGNARTIGRFVHGQEEGRQASVNPPCP
jgi:hypothetical protein